MCSLASSDDQMCSLASSHSHTHSITYFCSLSLSLFLPLSLTHVLLSQVGYQNSRFAQQVENYACLYTSKVYFHLSHTHILLRYTIPSSVDPSSSLCLSLHHFSFFIEFYCRPLPQNLSIPLILQVSNLGLVSPEMSFRTQGDVMPHDQLDDTPIRRMLKARGDGFVQSLTAPPVRSPSPHRL
jgi:hypothetical protein